MEERLSITIYKGKKILMVNLSGLMEEEIINIIETMESKLLNEKIKLIIIDVSDTITTKKIKEKSTQVIKNTEAILGKTYTALLGLRISQQIIANLIKRDQYFASSIDNAKDWLVKRQI